MANEKLNAPAKHVCFVKAVGKDGMERIYAQLVVWEMSRRQSRPREGRCGQELAQGHFPPAQTRDNYNPTRLFLGPSSHSHALSTSDKFRALNQEDRLLLVVPFFSCVLYFFFRARRVFLEGMATKRKEARDSFEEIEKSPCLLRLCDNALATIFSFFDAEETMQTTWLLCHRTHRILKEMPHAWSPTLSFASRDASTTRYMVTDELTPGCMMERMTQVFSCTRARPTQIVIEDGIGIQHGTNFFQMMRRANPETLAIRAPRCDGQGWLRHADDTFTLGNKLKTLRLCMHHLDSAAMAKLVGSCRKTLQTLTIDLSTSLLPGLTHSFNCESLTSLTVTGRHISLFGFRQVFGPLAHQLTFASFTLLKEDLMHPDIIEILCRMTRLEEIRLVISSEFSGQQLTPYRTSLADLKTAWSNLKRVFLVDWPVLFPGAMDFLVAGPCLTDLTLFTMDMHPAVNAMFVKQAPTLVKLKLWNVDMGSHVWLEQTWPRLKSFKFCGERLPYNMHCSPWYDNFPVLKKLSIMMSGPDKMYLTGFPAQLEELHLLGFQHTLEESRIRELTNLVHLSLKQSCSIVPISSKELGKTLQNFKHLRSFATNVQTIDLTLLEYLAPLAQLTKVDLLGTYSIHTRNIEDATVFWDTLRARKRRFTLNTAIMHCEFDSTHWSARRSAE